MTLLIHADARSIPLKDESVNCCVTSPPYWGLRDYGVTGQIGLEPTPELYVATMVDVFREVRRVLKADGTLWLNLGDSYAGGGNYRGVSSMDTLTSKQASNRGARGLSQALGAAGKDFGLAAKQLVGIPWRVAFALQADGWWLRSDIIWAKPNPMPESVTDRPTKAHEYLFLLAKSERYYYDAASIKTAASMATVERLSQPNLADQVGSARVPGKTNGNMKAVGRIDKQRGHGRRHAGFNDRWDAMEKAEQCSGTVNARSVWTIATQPYAGAHFATFPSELARRCILAGCPPGGIVLDPFVGSGTTVKVARELGREGIGVDINEKYLSEQAEKRIKVDRGFAFPS